MRLLKVLPPVTRPLVSRRTTVGTQVQHGEETLGGAPAATRENPALLIISGVSSSLQADDFTRLAPTASHIPGWTNAGGILKIWPHRNAYTMLPHSAFFVLFSNAGQAFAYQRHVERLHRLARRYRPTAIDSSTLMLPPARTSRAPQGHLPDLSDYSDLAATASAVTSQARRQQQAQGMSDQDLADALTDYSLADPSQELHIQLLRPPFGPKVAEMVAAQGYAKLTRGGWTGEKERTRRAVLFFLDGPAVWQPTRDHLERILHRDGRTRGMAWAVEDIEPCGLPVSLIDTVEARARWYQRPAAIPREPTMRLIVTMRDALEAQRFRRVWHRRTFPELTKSGETAQANVLILW